MKLSSSYYLNERLSTSCKHRQGKSSTCPEGHESLELRISQNETSLFLHRTNPILLRFLRHLLFVRRKLIKSGAIKQNLADEASVSFNSNSNLSTAIEHR